MADRVRADDTRDVKVRPNQLMVVSIPFEDRLVASEVEAHIVANAAGELLFEYGIASLSQDHPYFHPHHDNQPTFNEDAAYHKGTVWFWNAGPAITALTRFGYTDHAYTLTTNMVEQTLEMGTRGSLSELLDAHPDSDGERILARHRVTFDLPPMSSKIVVFDPDSATATVDGAAATVVAELASLQGVIGALQFVEPDLDAEYPTMQQQDYLEGMIVAGEIEWV